MSTLPNTGERLVTIEENQTMVEHLHRYAIASNYIAGKVVLDIASGEGYGSNLLAKKAQFVYGVDISEEAVQHATTKYAGANKSFLVGSAAKIPLDDASVDVVVSFETIEHHDQHDEMMKECKRVLKQDGVFIISSPDKKYYTDVPQYHNPFHVKELYKSEFFGLLKNYFTNVSLFKQGIVKGSVIYKEDTSSKPNGLNFYTGNYSEITSLQDIASPDYNLIIASDGKFEIQPDSFFQSEAINAQLLNDLKKSNNELRKYKKMYENINSSRAYKVGKFIRRPWKMLGGK